MNASPLSFLQRHGARRLNALPPQHPDEAEIAGSSRSNLAPVPDFSLFDDSQNDSRPNQPHIQADPLSFAPPTEEISGDSRVELNIEIPMSQWIPQIVGKTSEFLPHSWPPLRFVASGDCGRCVAWLMSSRGFPVAVRVAQIGAVSFRDTGASASGERILKREWAQIERVVAMEIDAFAWSQSEAFALALQENGFRLLPVATPEESVAQDGERWDFGRALQRTNDRTRDESLRLERQSIARFAPVFPLDVTGENSAALWIDGPLAARRTAFGEGAIVAGVVSQRGNWLHPQGWRTFYNLPLGSRTPAFVIDTAMPVLSWYLRLHGADDDSISAQWSGCNSLSSGIVRVEIPFARGQKFEATSVDELSRWLMSYREREGNSGAIFPLSRAAHSLQSLFSPIETVSAHFLHLTQL